METEDAGRRDVSALSEGLGPLPARTHFPGWADIPYYTADQMRAYALQEVQRAVGAMMSRCQGKVHEGCAYLGHCGMVCNKCGRVA